MTRFRKIQYAAHSVLHVTTVLALMLTAGSLIINIVYPLRPTGGTPGDATQWGMYVWTPVMMALAGIALVGITAGGLRRRPLPRRRRAVRR